MLEIRKAILSDSEFIQNAQLAMALETENMKLDPEIVKMGVSNVFSDPSKGLYWAAEFEGKVVGCLLVTLEWSDWRNGWMWWIQSVYVVPEFRGKKVYKEMYLYLQKFVTESKDIRGLRLYVDKTNEKAVQVYNKLGMNGEHYHLFEWMK